MNRRQFLRYFAVCGVSLALGNLSSCAKSSQIPTNDQPLLKGMRIIDAHAHSTTLKQIAEMSGRPLVDSHTSPCPAEDSIKCGRFRTWKDMERVAKTGGVVCTWPWAYQWGSTARKTFLDWAKEIQEMKKRLGMEHVG
jgi:microsomal dipeptidase-like Zn-dependent dipeptidase